MNPNQQPNAYDYYKRGTTHFDLKEWDAAIADFRQAHELEPDVAIYSQQLRDACREKQSAQTLDECMAPYAAAIENLKKNMVECSDIVEFSGIKAVPEYAEMIAALALFEEYELLEHFMELRRIMMQTYYGQPDRSIDESDILNARVRPEFAWWQPTPLYYITGLRAQEKMKDPCRMARFLVQHGADVNRAAADGRR